MADLFELGFVFRGFVIVSHKFKELPPSNKKKSETELRGAFISAINTFAEKTFKNTSLEYLEMENLLFIFKISEIQSSDGNQKEPLIIYGLTERKRNADKYVRKFLEKIGPILEYFIQKYNGADFTELEQFHSFRDEIIEYFD